MTESLRNPYEKYSNVANSGNGCHPLERHAAENTQYGPSPIVTLSEQKEYARTAEYNHYLLYTLGLVPRIQFISRW